MLLLEFVSYLGFFYYTHRGIEAAGPVPGEGALGAFPTLVASSLLPALVSYPGFGNQDQNLRELRAAAREVCHDKPRYPIHVDTFILIISLISMVLVSFYITESIEAPSETLKLSKSFVGLVVMPTIIASVEHITAILRSRKENVAWIIEIAFGSCIRIALFVFPLAVIIGWILDVPDMNMMLDGFQVAMLCLTIFLVNHMMHNGLFHW